MGTLRDEQTNPERSPGEANQTDGAPHEQIAALHGELASLRRAAGERDALEAMIAQLREANEHLVFATINAQGLRDDAEAAHRRQNEFLAMLAHELRNPLAPISMAAALLERIPDASAQLLNLTQVIGRQVSHMSRLLDDLLDAARISSGKITLSIQPVLLLEILAQAVETVQPRIGERRQQLAIDAPAGQVVIDGDRVRLAQVFSNLLGNASKYTGDAGHIGLAVRIVDGAAVVTVTDNGIGIAEDVIPHIFDLFTQGPRSLARSEGGLGVGLNVVRNLVTMHGGKVNAHSPGLGGGSEFVVTLPLSRQEWRVPAAAGGRGGQTPGCRVLLVEDNLDACDTLKRFLEQEGHVVCTAHDGRAGLLAAIGGAHDVVICDIGLPELDGLTLISRLRAEKGRAGAPFAIALSGYGQDEDSVRALDAGFNAYLVKPVAPAALLDCIASRA